MDDFIIHSDDVIQHFGVKGMKWGQRMAYHQDLRSAKRMKRKALRDSKKTFKQDRPNWEMRGHRKIGKAAIALGLAAKSPVSLGFGAVNLIGVQTNQFLKGKYFPGINYRIRNHNIRKAYKKAKKEIRSKYGLN